MNHGHSGRVWPVWRKARSRLLPGSSPAEIRTIATFWVVSERSNNVKLALHEADTDIRGIGMGYIGIYTHKISLPYKFLCGYWLFFFSLTQDKFNIVPVCILAKLAKLKFIHPSPPNEIPGYALTDILATILRMSVSVSWNASLTLERSLTTQKVAMVRISAGLLPGNSLEQAACMLIRMCLCHQAV